MVEVVLRDVREADLPALFEQQRDPDANRIAAFTAKDPEDRAAFMAHWARLLAEPSVAKKAILLGGRVAGSIASFGPVAQREVTYWIAREHWGKGVATAALRELLLLETTRPLFARAASDNAGSIRVLEKCGFRIVRHERGFANARGAEIAEVVLRLA
ncbi:MAG TPA: GNAT family N-acetyltransferase [Planctomycetota bacterium]|nr:GNAT family N-acetyltransferase [Planctomycetota bacterium]